MGKVSASTEGSNVKQTPSCLCCMYERKTIELIGGNVIKEKTVRE